MNKIEIHYKSGRSLIVTCEEFKVWHSGGEITRYEGVGMKPRPLLIGLDEIESIWEL